MDRKLRRAAIVLCACAAAGALAGAKPEDPAHAIREDDLRRHVRFLASDALAGRETGGLSIAVAEQYIANRFERAGLAPLPGGNGYFVDFTLYRSGYDLAATAVTVDAGEIHVTGRVGVDFRPLPFSDEGALEAPLVFAGYGITAPEHDYDDYRGLEVEDRIVLVLRHEPREDDPESPFDGTANSEHALFARKAENARGHGARGMILVTDPLHHDDPGDDLRIGGTLRLKPPRDASAKDAEGAASADPFLAVHVSRELAGRFLAVTGRTLDAFQRAVDEGTPPAALHLGRVEARLSVRRLPDVEEVAARNVAGFLKGRDPALAGEWIVIGAHHDHVGAYSGEGDTVFNGADDNASGVSGVLELAEAFAGCAERPRRSLVFMTFSGEEKGLLGSRAAVGRNLIPVDRVVFMLNLDMIGRNPERPVDVFGDGYVRGLRDVIERAAVGETLELSFAGTAYAGNSDHDPFHDQDIPFLFLFTGTHEDYHRLGDHESKLDYARMEAIVRLAYGVVDRLAAADEPPRFVHHVSWLGATVEVLPDAAGELAARVTHVEEGSRAGAAGLASGDVIVSFDGEALDDPGHVGRRFRAVKPGTRAALGVRRGDAGRTVHVARARTGYLGIAPGSLDEDRRQALGLPPGEGLVLRQVVPEGPAADAGLEPGDVVVSLAGRAVGTATLRSRLAQIGAGETVVLGIVRGTERLDLPVVLGERPEPR